MEGIITNKAHMCRFAMIQQTDEGPKFANKATGSVINSPGIATHVNLLCANDHQHVVLEGMYRIEQAQVYPKALGKAICRGLKELKKIDAMESFQIGSVNFVDDDELEEAMKQSADLHEESEWEQAWDDVNGEALNLDMVRQARREEIAFFKKMGVDTKVPIEECIKDTTQNIPLA